MDKIVLVLVADDNYMNHAKSLFYNIKNTGKWKGDLCLITPSELDTEDKKTFDNHNINILKVKEKSYYNKFFIFDEYFRKWDKVLYLDCDIFIFREMNEIFDMQVEENIIYASVDNDKLYTHFCQGWEHKTKLKVLNNLNGIYTGLMDYAFNTGVLYFNTSMINEFTVIELFKLKEKYTLINNHTNQKGTDQPILNFYFHNRFKEIDNEKFILKGSIDKNVILAHFYRWFAPWKNETLLINNIPLKNFYESNLKMF